MPTIYADNIYVVDISLACWALGSVVSCTGRLPVAVCPQFWKDFFHSVISCNQDLCSRMFYLATEIDNDRVRLWVRSAFVQCIVLWRNAFSPFLSAEQGWIALIPSAVWSPASPTTSHVCWTPFTLCHTLSSPCPPSESLPNRRVQYLLHQAWLRIKCWVISGKSGTSLKVGCNINNDKCWCSTFIVLTDLVSSFWLLHLLRVPLLLR